MSRPTRLSGSYDLDHDPGERNDIARENPDQVQALAKRYEGWFEDVSTTGPDNYHPPRIVVGSVHEPVTVLTRQDWRHFQGRPWAPNSNGAWKIHAEAGGRYRVRALLKGQAESIELRWGDASWTLPVPPGSSEVTFEPEGIVEGPSDLMAVVRAKDGEEYGPWHLYVEPLED